MRKSEFANGEYYHVYNRGVDKREVFLCYDDYHRFLIGMKEFNSVSPIGSLRLKEMRDKYKQHLGVSGPTAEASAVGPLTRSSYQSKLVDIIAYCLNPNHYHLILKQKTGGGVSEYMKRLGGGYTWYFNKNNSRSGALFQGKFKSVHISSNEYLLLLSAYVNANNFIHGYNERVEDWLYTSYLDYVGKRDRKLCNKEIILGQFDNNFSEYEKYIRDNMEYFKDKKEEMRYILE